MEVVSGWLHADKTGFIAQSSRRLEINAMVKTG